MTSFHSISLWNDHIIPLDFHVVPTTVKGHRAQKSMLSRYRILARPFRTITAVLVAVAATLDTSADAADVFAGKTVRIIVPAGPAGGYGLYGQLAANHFGRFIPGNPNVVISHMP